MLFNNERIKRLFERFCLSISLDNGGSTVVNIIYFVVKGDLFISSCTRDKSFCD